MFGQYYVYTDTQEQGMCLLYKKMPVLLLKISDYKQKHQKKFISSAQQFTPDLLESLLLNLQPAATLGFKSKLHFRCPGRLLFTALRLVLYSTVNYH